ncbi:MAG: hypothetical protein K6E50_01665 [Lachnospiraceae bacterium]|nr:hypothetical protein [Lachnospiraceae bacterium]
MKKHRLSILILLIFICSGCVSSERPSVLHVAMPYSDKVQDVESNYYINWLSEKTGLTLDITLIRQSRSTEYLEALFESDADIDVVLFGGPLTVREEELEKYKDRIYSENGTLCYYNNGSGRLSGAGQILWINSDWLKKLGLSIPKTDAQLREVLRAFRDRDPNGNGLADEIPLAASWESYASSPVEFLLNSYVYNDPYHSRFGIGEEAGAPVAGTDAFREGLVFAHGLYEEGLLADAGMASVRQLSELVNSPADLVGAFTTASVSDVIYPGNPEILSKYTYVAPLAGPEGVQNALYAENRPEVGAIITERSTRKEEAKLLLDTMLGEEASLIARFGEQGVDWDYSAGTDVSVYEGPSTIVTRNYLWNTLQNKHLNGIGPMNVPVRYLEGVTWNGVNSDTEYIDGHAQMGYRPYLPEVMRFHAPDAELSEYTDSRIREFVCGQRNIGSDEEWEEYRKGLECFY